jgi:peptidoglycan/xylan/chitin deacetylase (PgdA/CDA1 family)
MVSGQRGFIKNTPVRYKVAGNLFNKIPQRIINRVLGEGPIIFYYHMVSDEEVLHTKYLYRHKNIKQFENDLEYLLKNYFPISLEEVIFFIKNGKLLTKNSFVLSFDDGFREMYDIVAPILLKKGISAIFFINSGFVDNKELCYTHKASILAEKLDEVSTSLIYKILGQKDFNLKEIRARILGMGYHERKVIDQIGQKFEIDFSKYLMEYRPYLTSTQIMKLIKDGFYIGAHSVDHPIYSQISFEDQILQTIESIEFIKTNYGLNYGVFAFPENDCEVSENFFLEMKKKGIMDVSFGTSGGRIDVIKNNIQRFSLEKPLMPVEKILGMEFARKMYSMVRGNGYIERE